METNITPAHRNFVWSAESANSSFTVSFPKAPDMELILIGAELHSDPEEHDRLVLHFKGHPLNKKEALISGDPVEFIFKSEKLSTTWHGYIHHVRQNNTFQGGNTDIVCVGASWVLKDTDQKIFKDLTADQIVSRIAAKHGMKAVTQRDPRIRKQVVQAGQSDWQLCKSLAKQTGFTLFAVNTTLFFVSKDKIYDSKQVGAPYFNYVDGEHGGQVTREMRMTGTILNFEPIISDHAPEHGARVDRVMSGVDAKGATVKTIHPHKAKVPVKTGVVVPNERYFLS